MTDTTRLTDDELERYGEIFWDEFRKRDGFSPGWGQLWERHDPYAAKVVDGVAAVIRAYEQDHAANAVRDAVLADHTADPSTSSGRALARLQAIEQAAQAVMDEISRGGIRELSRAGCAALARLANELATTPDDGEDDGSPVDAEGA